MNANNDNDTLYENQIPISPFNHPYSMYHDLINDPDFRDFLIYKKMKNRTNDLYEPFTNNSGISIANIDNNEFDNLLLYIFTGIFILIMFDNVFKLGINF